MKKLFLLAVIGVAVAGLFSCAQPNLTNGLPTANLTADTSSRAVSYSVSATSDGATVTSKPAPHR